MQAIDDKKHTPIAWDTALIKKYDGSGPRYTSYPTVPQFSDGFLAYDVSTAWDAVETKAPLSLYVHIPFCASVCYYCACNKVVTKDHTKSDPYLRYLEKEIAQYRSGLGSRRVEQLHFGGGTPTFLNTSQIRALMAYLKSSFDFSETGDYSIEIDPRTVDESYLELLKVLGFNRLSFGVQDFDSTVQKAINRIQPFDITRKLMDKARALGFKTVNIDLIYGLPFQSGTSFAKTLAQVMALKPDRLSLFNYAHLPHLFKPQRRINGYELPDANEKLGILQYCIEYLTSHGYCYIGMDHFALPDDELAIAQSHGQLYRNFQGYSTHKDCRLLGLGVSAISSTGSAYYQNHKTLPEYYSALDGDQRPVAKGYQLDASDVLRREVIGQLICHFNLDTADIEFRYGIDFRSTFARELLALEPMMSDGLLVIANNRITITPLGRLLVRNICMVFDEYLQADKTEQFSRVI